ncbi:hypothetical protein F5J12DRAFT_99013 [Pisolithus orientalis]|uniref:uncharacterized protein n=1 Tax=Pisolithus orientalis TaxID=936130 RepID=UPI00222593CB|nr:uncharacterized protein F5J12DRAFT_99013 [Pisolithus orientalis]KAI6006546.1 hypothetical protein F5J12DRAFT_99013 [Pisolithus orientalis]
MALTDDISRKRAKLERCPPGHNRWDAALYELADALRGRYEKEDEIDDLNEAITCTARLWNSD